MEGDISRLRLRFLIGLSLVHAHRERERMEKFWGVFLSVTSLFYAYGALETYTQQNMSASFKTCVQKGFKSERFR